MEKEGLVERVDDKKDRRIIRVRLSKKGKDLAPKVISEYRSFLHQMISKCLTTDQQELLIRLFDNIKRSVENNKS
jgi:DNA-binding MarR family transcriptional regulator